jgi:hypothetical protein
MSAAEESGSDMAGSDAAKVTVLDWAVISAGLLAYISSYLPWYRASVSVLGIDHTQVVRNAWNAGAGAWVSVLLLMAAAGMVLLSTLGGRWQSRPTSRSLVTLSMSTLALITIVLRWVTFPYASGGFSTHLGELGDFDLDSAFTESGSAGYGLYLGLGAAVMAAVTSLLTFRAAARSGGQHD